MTKNQEHTPLMQQYFQIKPEHQDTLLFFQVGDFYELFFDDAKQAASFLGITLTARGKNKGEAIPLCGVPVHALDHYLHKLVKGGFKVAICDQLEDPKSGSIVKRGVTRVLTPGTLTETQLLDARSASYLFSFYPMGNAWGLLFTELLTAQMFVTTIPINSEKTLESELIRFFPDEILLPNSKQAKEFQAYFKRLGYFTTVMPDIAEDVQQDADTWITKQFSRQSEQVCQQESVRLALHYFYAYMSKNQRNSLDQFTSLFFYKFDDFLILDGATQRNLELIKNAQDGGRHNTLCEVMDMAQTAMGSRMIKKWISRPLVKQEAIVQRQDVIEQFIADVVFMAELKQILGSFGDVERVIGRIALKRASINDYRELSIVLTHIPHIKAFLTSKLSVTLIRIIVEQCADFHQLADLLQQALYNDSDVEYIIKSGFDEQLDHFRALVNESNKQVAELECVEQKATGIGSLKIRYNSVQGYYIEITKTHFDAVPSHYRRIQTLVGRERYTTVQLQQLQAAIEQAHKDIAAYEQQLFDSIKEQVYIHIGALRRLAHALAHIDALFSLATIAYDNGYIRPHLNDQHDIIIRQGRHPVVEKSSSTRFIPNDTGITDMQSLWIITGPNMGGKSTYLRQIALIAVMAHIGSFVPAQHANIALLDRIFTRLGSGDNVAEGKSTFLVEMEETATICTQATERSLVILDEVGRGTSTFDGLAIAQSVLEYLFNTVGARCLFATHYHELTKLHEVYPSIAVYHAASKKTATGIIFLYKMVQGVADGSFGIEVARLAELPTAVITRAQNLVEQFTVSTDQLHFVPAREEKSDNLKNKFVVEKNGKNEKREQIMQQIEMIDFNDLSPKKALDILWSFKEGLEV